MKTLIIQRACANFREAFFDFLSTKQEIILISKKNNLGKIKVPKNLTKKKYYKKIIDISFKNYNIYPFLFFDLLRISPHIIVSEGGQNTINNLSVLLYSKINKKKYFIWDLGRSYIEDRKSFSRSIYTIIYDHIINNSEGILTYNTQGETYFKSKFPQKKITVLNNTIDTNKVFEIKSDIDINKLNIIKSKFKIFNKKILFVGAINPKKNLEFLIDVIKRLGKDTCIIILGDGEKEYIDILKNKFLNYNVFFEGYKTMTEAVYYYNICDFSILPGLGGLAINQSLAFGVPVLVNRADGSEYDLIKNGITGYRYNKLDDLINFIKSQSEKDIIKMKQSSEELIKQNFTIEKMVQSFLMGIQENT
ncbi:MAG: glycosyltransferase [Atribacterota bacterium]|nr:glycosyltransferase [Atribacterota bacterium]